MRDISINSQSIIKMNLFDKSISILLCLLRVRSKVEIKISHLTLISSITIQNNFYICFFWDPFCQQILANWCSDSCNVKGFSDLDNIFDGIQTFLSLIDKLSMIWVDMLCNLTRKDNISTLFHSNWECL